MFSTLTTGRINNQLNIGNLHLITLKRHFCVMVRKQKGPYLPFLGYMHSGSGCLLLTCALYPGMHEDKLLKRAN